MVQWVVGLAAQLCTLYNNSDYQQYIVYILCGEVVEDPEMAGKKSENWTVEVRPFMAFCG